MQWKKPSEKAFNFLKKNLKNVDCQMKKMFGHLTYFIRNNMFIGVHEDAIFLRLSLADKEKVLAKYSIIKPFEPMPGRIMKEYVVIPEHIYNNKKIFLELLRKSIDYVSSLSSKGKRKKKR